MKNIQVKLLFLVLAYFPIQSSAQHSIAMEWNEVLLDAIRGDFARPTVHARNLYHSSVAMYDSWAIYDDEARPFFMGDTIHGFAFPLDTFPFPDDVEAARHATISYAMTRILRQRFLSSPGAWDLYVALDSVMNHYGYDPGFLSQDYSDGNPAALGNYIAAKILEYGLQDGSNEQSGYENEYYEPVNDPIVITGQGNPDISDPNRWQPITLDVFIDQSGNVIPDRKSVV